MERNTVGTRAIKRGKASRVVDGKDFRLADEIRYIQDKAAEHDLRMVTIGQLILFSTETGDAWLLDVTDKCGGPGCSDSFLRFLSGSPCFLFGRRVVLAGG